MGHHEEEDGSLKLVNPDEDDGKVLADSHDIGSPRWAKEGSMGGRKGGMSAEKAETGHSNDGVRKEIVARALEESLEKLSG